MSPTLLELVIVFILIWLGWQIGIQLAPGVFRQMRAAQQQLDALEKSLPAKPENDQPTDRNGSG
ncbi:MAG: hypothetical protein KDE47_13360 [Caldilineaceae bacterium]|nr:hypothetical protein [Caldilineaceae bacterium]